MGTAATGQLAKILLIEGNVTFAKELGEALRQEGFDVVHATQSAYALTMVEWTPPIAILCAMNLSEMGAFEVSRILHSDTKTAHLPVIAIGEGEEHGLMEAYRAGCDDYVDRRLGAESIAAQVRNFLRSRQEGFLPTQMLGSSESVLSGNLSHLDLPGVIQMLVHSRQTGVLHVNASKVDGIISFAAGEVFHAECGNKVGDQAVMHIVQNCNRVDDGVYKFVPGDPGGTQTVQRTATDLMLDALRKLDEGEDKAAEAGPR
jgi:DNA-binding response OmpR family regulator